MKKIITAINNPNLNEELKQKSFFEIIGKDIQYKEAILELLEKNRNIDLVIINSEIPGEIENEILIKRIKEINENIKIIFILETQNIEKEKNLKNNGINDIYYNDQIDLNNLINIINKKEINMEEEFIKLKKIVENKNIYKNEENNKKTKINKIKKILKYKIKNLENKNVNNKKTINKLKSKKKEEKKKFKLENVKSKTKNNIIKKFLNNKYFNKLIRKFKKLKNLEKLKDEEKNLIVNKKGYIITISGEYGVGKSTLASSIAIILSRRNYNILLIDLDIKNQNIYLIFDIKKYSKKIFNEIKEKNYYENISKNNKKNNNIIKNKEYLKNNYKNNYKNKLINENNFYNKNYFKEIFKKLQIKINKNIEIVSGTNLIFENEKICEEKNKKKIIENLIQVLKMYQKEFDYIIIDLGKSNNYKINKEVLKIANKNIVMMKGNLLGIKKIQGILEKYKYDYKIPEKSLHIVENEYSFKSINIKLQKEIFNKIKINKISYYKFFNNYTNKHIIKRKIIFNKKLKKEINKII